jgi:hypothetical protein
MPRGAVYLVRWSETFRFLPFRLTIWGENG